MNPGDKVRFAQTPFGCVFTGTYLRPSPALVDGRTCTWVEYRDDEATWQTMMFDDHIRAAS